MKRIVTFHKNPLTLVGRAVSAGMQAPGFTVASQDLQAVTLGNFSGKVKILTSFPSLDTPVCDLQVKEFNTRATNFAHDVVIVGISKDLPFAQKRFCETFDITNVSVVSDYKTGSFGINYGFLIKELNLLARSVVIVDKNDVIRYVQIVPEITSAPDYADVLKNLEIVLGSPALPVPGGFPGECKPCEVAGAAVAKEIVQKFLAGAAGWTLVDDVKLVKEFIFADFAEAKYFLDLLAVIAQEQGHHPNFLLSYNKVKVTVTTHAIHGLTENDLIMARMIDTVNA